jgi:hypothetical protein
MGKMSGVLGKGVTGHMSYVNVYYELETSNDCIWNFLRPPREHLRGTLSTAHYYQSYDDQT